MLISRRLLVALFAFVAIAMLVITFYDIGPSISAFISSTTFLPEKASSPLPTPSPEPEPWDSDKFQKKFTCFEPEWCDTYFDDTPEVQDWLFRHQNPPDCNTARLMIYPREWVAGAGSCIHVKGFHLGYAIEDNRTMIMPVDTGWAFGRPCKPTPTYLCYFEPFSNCTVVDHAPNWHDSPVLEYIGQYPNERIVRWTDDITSQELRPRNFTFNKYIPTRFRNKTINWWHAQMSRFLVKPNNRTKEIVEREQKRMFPPNGTLPHPFISMYVRHGDKWSEGYKPYSLADHMAMIADVADVYNITHIVLGTEDEKVIEDTKDPTWANFTFHYVTEPRNNTFNSFMMSNMDDGETLMNNSLSNLYIQLQGDVFIGTRSSNWARLIDELRKTTGKARVPYFSPEPKNMWETVE